MGINEEIFEEFFEKLEEDKEIFNVLIAKLKELWKNGNMNSQEKIFEAIKGVYENANQD